MATFGRALATIQKLRRLPDGWDYGFGSAASARAADGAFALLQLLSGLGIDDFDVAPGSDGGITVFAYRGDDSVEIQAFPNGTYDFLLEEGDVPGDLHENLDLKAIVQKLEEAGWRSPRLFVSCTRAVTWPGSADLHDPLLAIRPAMVVFQSSAPIALPRGVWRSAPTFVSSTTKEYAGTRQSSGEYRELRSPKVSA
jgi:hypothetical protein